MSRKRGRTIWDFAHENPIIAYAMVFIVVDSLVEIVSSIIRNNNNNNNNNDDDYDDDYYYYDDD